MNRREETHLPAVIFVFSTCTDVELRVLRLLLSSSLGAIPRAKLKVNVMDANFVIADSDPSTCMPFIVHLAEPRFFAMIMPKVRQPSSGRESVESMSPGSALRGLNLYPAFMTDPSGYDYKELMALFQKGARQFWRSMMGGGAARNLPDSEISVVFREEGTFVPPHLYGSDGQASYIIRTESPKMIWQVSDEMSRECSWRETCTDLEFEEGTAAAFSFYKQYLEQEAEV